MFPVFDVSDLSVCSEQQPCQNGATCVMEDSGEYTCLCPEGFHGRDCQLKTGPCHQRRSEQTVTSFKTCEVEPCFFTDLAVRFGTFVFFFFLLSAGLRVKMAACVRTLMVLLQS